MPRRPPFTESALRAAIETSDCWAAAARALGYEVKGHNLRTVQRWAAHLQLDVSHFDGNNGRRRAMKQRAMALDECLVANSTYPRGKLKRRLLSAGLLKPVCEKCGQGELWNGARMSLILDHINGVANDHRLENLRILCPNCNATLSTHCGRNLPRERACASCGEPFVPKTMQHRYCSQKCWGQAASHILSGTKHPEMRKVVRPSFPTLKRQVTRGTWTAVGCHYGVSDNAVRKWVRTYERSTAADRDFLATVIQAALDNPDHTRLTITDPTVLGALDAERSDPV
jgi:hypothetical protein